MALPSSGTLTIEDIANEFGGVVPHDLSEYYGADTGVPTSGELSISDFYGTENTNAVDSMSGSDWANMGSIGSPVSSGTGFASGTSLYWGPADAPFTSAANNTPKYSEGGTGTVGGSGFQPFVDITGFQAFEYSTAAVSIGPGGWFARSLTIPVQKLRRQTYNWSLDAAITGSSSSGYDPNPTGQVKVILESYGTWNSAGSNSYVSNLQNSSTIVDTGIINQGTGWQSSYSGQFTNTGEYVMLKVYLLNSVYVGLYGPYTGIRNFGLTKA